MARNRTAANIRTVEDAGQIPPVQKMPKQAARLYAAGITLNPPGNTAEILSVKRNKRLGMVWSQRDQGRPGGDTDVVKSSNRHFLKF